LHAFYEGPFNHNLGQDGPPDADDDAAACSIYAAQVFCRGDAKSEPINAWIVDDTGFVTEGTHSVGVARQYCGQVGKQENCRVAVSLSISTAEVSLPIAWRLYLPEVWVQDKKRRQVAGVPREIRFQTKPDIALQQVRSMWWASNRR
jgi:SRSO17 transposase